MAPKTLRLHGNLLFFILGIFFRLGLLFKTMNAIKSAIALPVGTTCNYSTYRKWGYGFHHGAQSRNMCELCRCRWWFTVVVPTAGAFTIDSKQAGGITDGGAVVYTGACDRLQPTWFGR